MALGLLSGTDFHLVLISALKTFIEYPNALTAHFLVLFQNKFSVFSSPRERQPSVIVRL